MEFTKNQIYTTEITDIGINGEGIGRTDGFTVFVNNALPGEKAEILMMKVKKNYGYGKLTRIITPSPDRVKPLCPIADKCGGCSLQHLAYPAQLKFKQALVRENLRRIGGFEGIDVLPVIDMDEPYYYRSKGQYPVSFDKKQKKPNIGFYARASHRVIDCGRCFIADKCNEEIITLLRTFIGKNNIPVYSEETHSGLIRHILIRNGANTGEIMVCLIINYRNAWAPEFIYAQDELIEKLIKIKGMKSISVNINNDLTNVILGKETHTIWGTDTIRDILMGLTFEISPVSFYQVNPLQTEKLYGLVREFAELSGNEEVWDICCGIGTIALMLAKKAGKVHGIEIVPEAVENARGNARLNNIDKAEFVCAPAEEFLPIIKDDMKADIVVMDPPRKGMDIKTLDAVLEAAPSRIIYVSCDSSTLARDLKHLCKNGY
ncbi:MAG: 23S rRNA (uracil(1939)-C(5))-methyltransferase RlmD, partial [Firmicutes bacterium]|nr:23S rRNA (uracil(1939)-C(5))-methyltransferase RlmD [Bacillota bacterium]